MKIYIYDMKTGVFITEQEAQKNPKRSGEFIYPPNYTLIAPPDCEENEAPVFTNGAWKIVPDYRFKQIINTRTFELDYVQKVGELEDDCMLYSEYLNSDLFVEHQKELERESEYNLILDKIEQLDEKRIRAICEPSVKDDSTGETWLDYYNSRIKELRKQLVEV